MCDLAKFIMISSDLNDRVFTCFDVVEINVVKESTRVEKKAF